MRLVFVFSFLFIVFPYILFAQANIVGGEDADIEDYPYQAALLYNSGGWSYAYCGASIINQYWILTAAHCVEGESANNTVVRVGSDNSYAQGGTTYDADEIIIHNNYNSNTMNNDIALIKLENPISFNSSRQPVFVMCDEQVDLGVQDPGEMSWVTGWGDTEGTTNSSQLQVVGVPITTQSNYGWGQIDADMIMAGYPDGEYDSCQGDSGGPMVVLAADGETHLQCGIVSWGSGCADVGYPGVYTRVSYFIDWICDNTDGVVCANESDFCAGNAIYGCMDPTAENYNSEATVDDGSCEYLCNQTVSLVIIFDCWPEETGWSITNENGNVITSQNAGYYSSSETAGDICLSAGCYTFTITDIYGDGLGGSQWSSCGIDGSYEISVDSEILVSGEGDFGFSNSYDFCVSANTYGCTDQNAVNYNMQSNIDDGSCSYVIPITGCKISDNDCNGYYSDGDEYLSGWSINWDNGYETGSVVTGDDGCYFVEVPAFIDSESEWDGIITMSEVFEDSSYFPFEDNDIQIVQVDFNNLVGYEVNFFNCPKTELCGYKYIDVNCNCVYDSLDYPYEGWPMNLWLDDGTCPPTLIHTEITDQNGQYCFNLDSLNLNNNYTYILAEEIPGESGSYPSIPGYAPCEPGLTGFGCAFSGGAPVYNINTSSDGYESNYVTASSPNGEGVQIINSDLEHNFFNCIVPCEVQIYVEKYIHDDCSTSSSGNIVQGEDWDISLVSFNGDTLLTTTTNNEGGSMLHILCDSLEVWSLNGPISIVETMQPNYISCSNYPSQHEIYYETVSMVPPLSSVVGTYDSNGVLVPQTNYEFHNISNAIIGCTDPNAYNYNSNATVDDGSCLYTQVVELKQGWNIWSTYINETGNIADVFDLIENDVVITKDENGNVYWPQYGLNSIGNLIIGSGYQTKMSQLSDLEISGPIVSEDYLINIDLGWSIIGYLNQDIGDIVQFFEPYSEGIVIVKDEDGNVYWPEYSLNSIGNMSPGEGYQIKTSTNFSFSYEELVDGRLNFIAKEDNIHFEKPKVTGNNMTILFPFETTNSVLNANDEVATYDQNGLLVGSAVVSNRHSVITLWGDDITTLEKDGLSEGERIVFRLWSSKTATEQVLDIKWKEGAGIYSTDGISVAGQIILGSELTSEKQLVKIIDVLGREINGAKKEVMLLYIYDDGSIDKKYIKE